MRQVHRVSEELDKWCGNAITLKRGHLGMASGEMWAILGEGVRPVVSMCHISKHFTKEILSYWAK